MLDMGALRVSGEVFVFRGVDKLRDLVTRR